MSTLVSRSTAAAVLAALLLGAAGALPEAVRAQSEGGQTAIVIHGGAGGMSQSAMSADQKAAYRTALYSALQKGNAILQNGGSALDAVVAAITAMESDTLFNAARGAVTTSRNTVELDAAIMDGNTRNAGAVTGVQTVRHPIRLARTVMSESEHVMMAQEGAETFAEEQGFETVENSYFMTGAAGGGSGEETSSVSAQDVSEKFGTVGAVALDENGNLAAGTSTGGIPNKRFGRVGDSPIIGAGTYANNESVAVSATGQGEYYMRTVAAHNVAARVRFGGSSLREAARAAVEEAESLGGVGGVIALDTEGNIATPFVTSGMFRAYVDTEGNAAVRIFGQQSSGDM